MKLLALAIASAGGVAAVGGGLALFVTGALAVRHRVSTWWLQLACALGLVALLPWLLAHGDWLGPELTTWGAAGLIYAGPWAVAIGASAWTTRSTTAALLATTAGCAALAAVGPQMVSVFGESPERSFLAVAIVVAVLVAVVNGFGVRAREPVGS